MTVRVAILARYPEPGKCKTRLIPALGEEGAAELHRKLTERTLDKARASGLMVELWGTGGTKKQFKKWLGPVRFREQPEGDLGERLLAAADPYPVIFLGTDCPDFKPKHLRMAAAHLEEDRFVIGPAHDGGYWTIGLPHACKALFRDMPWGTEKVYNTTLARMAGKDIKPKVLKTLHDLDRPEDLERWPELLS
ncbi:TIGR04282 family arsenosugar biosynthesis glycosyltransferase [Parvularcula lutaonensis]|uniref:TIGR04282 family arsenosugar biosynthesis glycosyltransferase n=1 Tax=Parvularcula lutaonensis TaxID=491923 RepID=A0ABV7M7Q7_9PROT|nr:TIGR04282 family arsenosugar biosynthesis glycosyltransferase [Parvularcula lutaonensis]GGY57066.1 hypothetical protein GCM10007148_28230 [Parvularcula lutaonensis]